MKAVSSFNTISNLFLLLCLFNGLIVALLKYTGINSPISPINLIAILFFPLLLFRIALPHTAHIRLKILIQSILLFILFKVLVLIFTSGPTLTDTITFVLYGSCILSIYFFATQPNNKASKALQYFRISFLVFGIIYFVQYSFHQVLPPAFTEIPNLFVDIGVERYTREVSDILIYRPNGLIGNPITLGYFLNLLFSIELFFWNKTKSKIIVFRLLLLAIMICLLFSRANILLLFLLCFFNFSFRKRFVKVAFLSIFFIITIIGALYSFYGENIWITYTVDRFLGIDVYAAASTEEHIEDYKNAFNTYLDNPFVGISPEQELKENIITDGAVFILLLHFGTIGFMMLMVGYVKLIQALKRLFLWNKDFAPQLVLLTLLIPYSVLNSAVLNKGLLLITGIYIGIFLNFYYNEKNVQS